MATDQKTAAATQPVTTAIERSHPVGELPSVELDPTKGRVGYYSSLKPTDNTSRSRLYNAMVGNAKPLEDAMGDIVLIEHIIATPVEIKDGLTGEIKPAVRTILVQPNGVMFGCVSEGIRNSIRKLAGVFSEPPWDGGLELKVLSQKAKVGRVYYLERPTDAEIEAFHKKQKEADDKAKKDAAAK
jgi:hypothetical protein